MSIFWLLLLAPIISQSLAQFSTEDDDLFVVYDYFNDGDSSHKQPPSCILATFKAKLILDDGIELDILPSNLTWISTHNHTCGEEHQTLELFWDEDSSMILSFTREPNSTAFYFLDRVQLRCKFSAISEDNFGRMDISADSGANLNLFKTPRFFAYVCQEPLNVSLPVNVSTHGVKFIEPKATLQLTQVKFEAFREDRYYDDITHLRYDCIKGWPYLVVEVTICSIVTILAIVTIFQLLRRYKSRSPKKLYKPAK
eukprot:01748.XXX_657_1751_1 [CDS] Oithona nana genome sequencing.